MHNIHIIGERERAYLVVQTARFLYIYIYIFISGVDVCRNVLRNSKLHFPLVKNVMHSPSTSVVLISTAIKSAVYLNTVCEV